MRREERADSRSSGCVRPPRRPPEGIGAATGEAGQGPVQDSTRGRRTAAPAVGGERSRDVGAGQGPVQEQIRRRRAATRPWERGRPDDGGRVPHRIRRVGGRRRRVRRQRGAVRGLSRAGTTSGGPQPARGGSVRTRAAGCCTGPGRRPAAGAAGQRGRVAYRTRQEGQQRTPSLNGPDGTGLKPRSARERVETCGELSGRTARSDVAERGLTRAQPAISARLGVGERGLPRAQPAISAQLGRRRARPNTSSAGDQRAARA